MANWTLGDEEKKRYGEIIGAAVKNIYDQQQKQQTQTEAQLSADDADIRAKYPVTQAYDKTTDYMAQMQQAANQGYRTFFQPVFQYITAALPVTGCIHISFHCCSPPWK